MSKPPACPEALLLLRAWGIQEKTARRAAQKHIKLKLSAVGCGWEGRGKGWEDDVLFCLRQKRTSEQSRLYSDVVEV